MGKRVFERRQPVSELRSKMLAAQADRTYVREQRATSMRGATVITVQNDWVEYAAVPVRRTAVRGGGACAGRIPVSAQRVRPAVVPEASSHGTTAHRAAPLRLTRRGRVVLVLLPAVLGLSSAFVGMSAPFAQADPSASPRTIEVRSGDTLWAIAERVAPERDPRDVVAELERVNHLPGAVVLAGSRLEVPVTR